MNSNLKIQLKRVEELLIELEDEYNKSLNAQHVSDKALVITGEIVEKLSNLLDQITYKIWKHEISANLSDIERVRAGKRIYFPSQASEQDFINKLVEWRAIDAKSVHSKVFNFFKSLQPFFSVNNEWIRTLKELARNKHVDLIPQKRQEITNVTYSNANGTVMFTAESVKFGSGASILGAPVDPLTQRIVPTEGINEKIERWVSFKFGGYDLDALSFCKDAAKKVEKILTDANSTFSLNEN